ncbi:RluA family pseudouridine synthase [Aureibacter tunicatorum]|uniref:Pseudouridine synthase n=1 Tax=Aureibacter tunicatorum TaxID=866807 RepID=A0AAE4BSP9_9BACT|nr:RluA family pseudouridine synthase [Aureibacter tunicatorum]MDR6239095.1 23S rRNA pseudouridine1911/1915/1917 synthase [Aureibacter tunicatorum]BDD04979.1 pseudouridine synthase [Aureibacter tunicatorum]
MSDLFLHESIIADKLNKPTRLDKYLSITIKNKSRSTIQDYIKKGKIRVNTKMSKSNYVVKEGDLIELFETYEKENGIKPMNFALDIIFENDHYIVINKPSGMPMHPGLGNYDNSLLNALSFHYNNTKQFENLLEDSLVQRLDKDTTGLVVVAKTKKAYEGLSKQFQNKQNLQRTYYALCWGTFKNKKGTIRNYIGRNPNNLKSIEVSKDKSFGKLAVTHYEVLKTSNNFSWVKCTLETGRTHQIRVHMQSINHPLVGDLRYQSKLYPQRNTPKSIKHHLLHASILQFSDPESSNLLTYENDPDWGDFQL